MEPHLADIDKQMFYSYLDRATVYLEYGSGGSTYQAHKRNNIKKIYSVESDWEWHNLLNNKLASATNIEFIFNDMNTLPNNWGYPGPNSTREQIVNYSDHIIRVNDNEIDLILIDGRFRVACCLKCFGQISNTSFIAFDDFLDRPEYHLVLDYYEIVKYTTDNRMVILQKKQNIDQIPEELIRQYELVSR